MLRTRSYFLFVPLVSKAKVALGASWNDGEFGGQPMPGLRTNAEGQYRAKQAGNRWACVETMCHPRKGRYSPDYLGIGRGWQKCPAPQIKNLRVTYRNGLSQGVYGDGSVSNSVGGLQLLVASSPTTGVVGGIDRASWVFWRNQAWSAATNGSTVLSSATILSQMDSLWVQLVRGRDYPDLIIADNVTYKYYLAALQAIQRIGPENTAPDLAEYGFQSLKYLNADVVLDGGFQGFSTDPLPPELSSSSSAVGGAPSTTMYFLAGSSTVH